MSKKFGINSKAAEARARKTAVKEAADRDKQQRLEDEYWREDDKQVLKKQHRKEEREHKEHEKQARKQEAQKLLEQEEAVLAASRSKKHVDLASRKLTQAQIQHIQHENAAAAAATQHAKHTNDDDTPLEENVNRLHIDGSSARNVEEAIQVLSSSQAALDSHPEKRVKAAYETFEQENLPRLKQEHPSLRLSQLKQMLRKEWMKSPDNPFNKPTRAYNEGLGQKQASLPENDDSDNDKE